MTIAKRMTRGRRRASTADVPREMAAWFAGRHFERRPLLFARPHGWQVAELWRTWSADNPGAIPPASWEWLADPQDNRQRRPAHIAAAKAAD